MNAITATCEKQALARVADHYGVSERQVLRANRSKPQLIWVRRVFVHILWTFTDLTQEQIGIAAGYKAHPDQNAKNAIKRVREKCAESEGVKKEIIEIESLFE